MRKILRFAAWALAFAVAIAAALYFWLAFAPSGMEGFIKENSEAVERVETLISSPPEQAEKARPSVSTETSIQSEAEDTAAFTAELIEINELAWRACKEEFWDDVFPGRVFSGFSSRWKPKENIRLESGDSRLRVFLSDAQRKRLFDAHYFFGLNWFPPWDQSRVAPAHPSDREKCQQYAPILGHQALDTVEAFLLSPDRKAPTFEQWPYYMRTLIDYAGFAETWGLPILASSAIMRALDEGKTDKAARILREMLEIVRTVRLQQLTARMESFGEIQQLLLALTQTESFPRESLIRALESLDSMRVSREEFDTWWTAEVVRREKFADTLLYAGPPEDPGVFGLLRYRFFRPLISRQFEKAAVFQREQWKDGTTLTLEQRVKAGRVLDVMTYWGACKEWLRSDVDFDYYRPSFPIINKTVEFSMITLASGWFRRDRGRWPESIEELLDGYLDSAFLGSSELAWSVFVLEPQSRPTVGSLEDKELRTRFIAAVKEYWEEGGALPGSVDNILPYLKEPQEIEIYRRCFVEMGPTPAIVCYQPVRSGLGHEMMIPTGNPECPGLIVYAQIPRMPLGESDPFEWLVTEEYIEEWEAKQEAEASE